LIDHLKERETPLAVLVKKFPAFYGIQIMVHYRVQKIRHWFQSWDRWIQFTPSYRISSKYIL